MHEEKLSRESGSAGVLAASSGVGWSVVSLRRDFIGRCDVCHAGIRCFPS